MNQPTASAVMSQDDTMMAAMLDDAPEPDSEPDDDFVEEPNAALEPTTPIETPPEPVEPVAEPVAEPAPVAEAAPAAAAPEPTIEERLAEKEAEIERLRGLVSEVAGARVGRVDAAAPAEPVVASQGFVTSRDDFDNAMASPEGLNQLMNKVYAEGQKSVQAVSIEARGRVDEVNKRIAMNDAVSEWYDDNKDLRNVKAFVGFVANDLESKKEYTDVRELLTDVEKEVRTKLNLPRPSPKVIETEPSPAFPGGATGVRDSSAGVMETPDQRMMRETLTLE